MPGKLDHASVVAFRVGQWDTRDRTPRPLVANNSSDTLKQNGNCKNLLPPNLTFLLKDSLSHPTEAPPPVPTSLPPSLSKEPIVNLNCMVRISRPTQSINVHAVSIQECLFSSVLIVFRLVAFISIFKTPKIVVMCDRCRPFQSILLSFYTLKDPSNKIERDAFVCFVVLDIDWSLFEL